MTTTSMHRPPLHLSIYPSLTTLPFIYFNPRALYLRIRMSHSKQTLRFWHVLLFPLFTCLRSDKTSGEKATSVLESPAVHFLGGRQGNRSSYKSQKRPLCVWREVGITDSLRFDLTDDNTALFKLLNT